MKKLLHRLLEDIWAESEYRFNLEQAEQHILALILNTPNGTTAPQPLDFQKADKYLKRIQQRLEQKVNKEVTLIMQQYTTRTSKIIKSVLNDSLTTINNQLQDLKQITNIDTPQTLLTWLCIVYHVSIKDIRSRSRKDEYVNVRKLYCYMVYKLWNRRFPIERIAKEINRSPENVSNSVRAIKNDSTLLSEANVLLKQIEFKFGTSNDRPHQNKSPQTSPELLELI